MAVPGLGASTVVRFGPVDIQFDQTVLRPRPWTLAQSEWAAELANGSVMLELGCGAGQIGLAAAVLGGCPVLQVDVDPAACDWARRNAARNGCTGLAAQRCGLATAVVAKGERFSVVLADPPYVPTAEVARFPEDPVTAIDGGQDGLSQVRSFLLDVGPHLHPHGASVLLQLWGPEQAAKLADWLAEPGAPRLALAEIRTFGPDRAVVRLDAAPTVRG